MKQILDIKSLDTPCASKFLILLSSLPDSAVYYWKLWVETVACPVLSESTAYPIPLLDMRMPRYRADTDFQDELRY